MSPRPEFAVVAGPNGAGKSRLSPLYISASGNYALNSPFPAWFEANFLRPFKDIVGLD